MLGNYLKKHSILYAISRNFCESSIQKTFTYGQDSVLKVRKFPKNTNMFINLSTLWEDHSTVKLSLKDQENVEQKIDPKYFDLNIENEREISIKYPQKLQENDFPYEQKKQNIEAGIPEYSSIDLEFEGSIIHRSTDVDAKIKGDVLVTNLSENPQDFVEIPRLKSENCKIILKSPSQFVKRYLEAQYLDQHKSSGGMITIKRLGISKKMVALVDNTYIKIPTFWVNPCDIHSNFQQQSLDISLRNSTLDVDIFTGPIAMDCTDSTVTMNEANLESIDWTMKGKSQANIGLRSIGTEFGKNLGLIKLQDNSSMALRINEELQNIVRIVDFDELAKQNSTWETSEEQYSLLNNDNNYKIVIVKQKSAEVKISYENSSINLRDMMLKKFNEIKKDHPGRKTKRKTE